ncbi:MAG: hypothetical protein SGI88_20955 [Candidatus Hydrogenedentes bacterium]|nr:hypothetical protein [Candidatus Hydrogenedentota bacterium]
MRNGEFHRPRAIAADSAEIYVIDTTGRVQVFTHAGEWLRSWNMPEADNGTPTGITFASKDRIVIPDTHYSRIMEITTDGEVLDTWGAFGTGESEFIYPTDVVIGPDGRYFISEYGVDAERLHVFDADRKFVQQWGSHGDTAGNFSRAMSLTIVKDELFIADTANHRIQCFTFDGVYRRALGGLGAEPGQLRFPHDIARAPDDTLIVCEYGNNRISRYTCEGRCIGTLGQPGRGYGEFNTPRGVSVSPQGTVFVADTDNDRIQRFALEDFA